MSETAASITVSWSAKDSAGYHLINEKRIERIAQRNETTFTYKENIAPGRNYLLAIRTMATDGSAGPPAVLVHRTAGDDGTNVNAAANPAPTVETTDGSVTLTWPNVADNNGYTIVVDGQPRADSPLRPDQNKFVMTGLQADTHYLVEVQTIVDSGPGNSEWVAVLAKTKA